MNAQNSLQLSRVREHECIFSQECSEVTSSLSLHFQAIGTFDAKRNVFEGTLQSLTTTESVEGAMRITLTDDKAYAGISVIATTRHKDGFYTEQTQFAASRIEAYDDWRFLQSDTELTGMTLSNETTYDDERHSELLSWTPAEGSKLEIVMTPQ